MIEKHYRHGELAELLGVNPETIRRAIVAGHLAYVTIGSRKLFPESAVRRWLAAGGKTQRLEQFDRAAAH